MTAKGDYHGRERYEIEIKIADRRDQDRERYMAKMK